MTSAALLTAFLLIGALVALALCAPIPPDEYPLSKHGDDDDFI